MATFSGFVSTALSTDIMSNVRLVGAVYSGGDGNANYNAGYMYIGNLLIQFTYFYPVTGPELPATSSSGSSTVTIYFPISYSPSTPYCVLTSPFSNSQTNYTITVSDIQPSYFIAKTGNGNYGSIQYIAIGPK